MNETNAKTLTVCCFPARQRDIDDEKKYPIIKNEAQRETRENTLAFEDDVMQQERMVSEHDADETNT